jgi:hypothetical protein
MKYFHQIDVPEAIGIFLFVGWLVLIGVLRGGWFAN